MEVLTGTKPLSVSNSINIMKHANSRTAILHVRENSIDELEALFDPSKWSTKQTKKLPPLYKRNLPSSFFQPPETGTKTPKNAGNSAQHSRQSSIDQSFLSSRNHASMLNKQYHLIHQKLTNLSNSNNHSRSVSEPVDVSPLAYANFNNQHQNSQQGLPFGWQTARTTDGTTYYIK
jgi:protein yorkie